MQCLRRCHQPTPKGGRRGRLSGARRKQETRLGDYLMSALFNGIRAMPPVGRMMSDEQAADVTNYVRAHFGNNYDDRSRPRTPRPRA